MVFIGPQSRFGKQALNNQAKQATEKTSMSDLQEGLVISSQAAFKPPSIPLSNTAIPFTQMPSILLAQGIHISIPTQQDIPVQLIREESPQQRVQHIVNNLVNNNCLDLETAALIVSAALGPPDTYQSLLASLFIGGIFQDVNDYWDLAGLYGIAPNSLPIVDPTLSTTTSGLCPGPGSPADGRGPGYLPPGGWNRQNLSDCSNMSPDQQGTYYNGGNFSGGHWGGFNLSGASLYQANFSGSSFRQLLGPLMTRGPANFSNAFLEEANFTNCVSLAGVSFRGADLQHAHFSLQPHSIRGMGLLSGLSDINHELGSAFNANFSNADLRYARFDIPLAVLNDSINFQGAIINSGTRFPPGFIPVGAIWVDESGHNPQRVQPDGSLLPCNYQNPSQINHQALIHTVCQDLCASRHLSPSIANLICQAASASPEVYQGLLAYLAIANTFTEPDDYWTLANCYGVAPTIMPIRSPSLTTVTNPGPGAPSGSRGPGYTPPGGWNRQNLSGSHPDMSTSQQNTNYNGTNFSDGTWAGFNFSQAHLYQADFSNATLINRDSGPANFTNAFLEEANFTNCHLALCNFQHADLQNAVFRGTVSHSGTGLIRFPDLIGVNLSQADLRHATFDISPFNLVTWNFQGAIISRDTRFPPGFIPVGAILVDDAGQNPQVVQAPPRDSAAHNDLIGMLLRAWLQSSSYVQFF